MADIKELLKEYRNKDIALYGLGTETERFINEYGGRVSMVGLLDGFRTDGEIYGYPIMPIAEAPAKGVRLIIVVARPGSCKAIVKRIGGFCSDNCIALFDVRGRDLLIANNITYDFIKIPYHGNYLKRLEDLLKSTNSKYGVMTCSSSEGCEDKTLEVLNNYNIQYYMTKNGSISVLSNGKDIIINQ